MTVAQFSAIVRPMDDDDLLARLRAADEDDVGSALTNSYVELGGVSRAELVEFFNRMLDVLVGETEA